ncbi:MAG TPA: portal protein, partial [Agitococcus sp.]|nr:portal protein [Agitococcus sp.]
MAELLDQFKQRYNRAMQISYLWASLHEACYFYAIPNRNRFWRPKEQQGEAKGTRVYDTTAIEATKTFVSKLHTAMTPPQTQWGFLSIDPEFDEDDAGISRDDAQRLLNDYMRKLFDYIHDSNFDVVINECYFDLAVGTSCLVINQYTDDQPLLFTSIPMDKLAIEEAMTGKIESWYRNWEDVKANEITVRWPKAVLPDELKREIKNNPDYTIKIVYEGVMYNPQNTKKYQYVVCSDNNVFYTEDFEVNPGIVWRFQKTNADTYGRGPIMDALPSIISLNELARIELAAANLNTFKPYMAFSDAVFNPHTFKMQPMTVIPIAPLGSSGQVPLIPLPDTSNPQFSQLSIQDLRMQIRSLL